MTRFPTHYALTATLDSLGRHLANQRATTRAAVEAVGGYKLREEILSAVAGHTNLFKDRPPS